MSFRSINPTRVLIDRCVVAHGQTGRLVSVLESIRWGPATVTLPVTMLQGKRVGDDQLQGEVIAISAISAAARAGAIVPCSSLELMAEAMSAGDGCRGSLSDLWAGILMEDVDPPIGRSKFGRSLLSSFCSKEQRERFFELLLELERRGVPPEIMALRTLTDFERESLTRIGEFAALCKFVGPTHRADAFHLWTAMRHDLRFVTTDFTFLRSLALYDPNVAWRACTPSEFVDAVGLERMDLPLRPGELDPFGCA